MPVPNAQSGLTRFLSHDATEQGETNPFSDYLKHHSGEFIGFIVGGMIALILTYCICREYINTKWGHGCCYGPQEAARHRATMLRELRLQTMADARVVAELQRELDNEREQQLSENRKQERREKYERFLKPYTMVVEDCHIGEATPSQTYDGTGQPQWNSRCQNDLELGAAGSVDSEVWLMLPARDGDKSPRRVDGICSVCLLPYETGDRVSWATRRVCQHAFHHECILVWLSRGKKRCPICRNFFVPCSKPVDEVKVITHDDGDEDALRYEEVEEDIEESLAPNDFRPESR